MEDNTEKVNYKKLRDKILQRDKYICQKCKTEFPTDELDIHHIAAKSLGGSSAAENVQTLCKKHHRLTHKETSTLEEYAFEFKHFNHVERIMDSFLDDIEEENVSAHESERRNEELGDVDIEELDDLDKEKNTGDEV